MDQNNKIENFFNKKFSQPTEAQEWNTPPEDTWDIIMDGLEEKPSKRRYAIYLPWILGLIAIFISSFLFLSNKTNSERIQTLENKIEDIGLQSDLKNLETNNNVKTDYPSQVLEKEESTSETNENIITKVRPSKTIAKSKKTTQLALIEITNKQLSNNAPESTTNLNDRNNSKTSKNQSFLLGDGNNSRNNINGTKNVTESNTSTFNNQIGLLENPKKTINILSIDKLLFDAFLIAERNKTEINGFLSPTQRVENQENTLAIYAGLTSRYNQWIDVTSGLDPNPLEGLRVDENTLSSFAHGVSASLELGNKWTGNIGLLYNQRNNQTYYLLQLPFSTNTEMLDSEGDLTNAFQHSLPTALGDVKTDVTLARSQSSTIANNELVGIDLSFQNRTRSLIIPLSSSYFIRAANDGFYIVGGIVNEFTLSAELSDIQSTSLHDTVDDKIVDVQYNDAQINKYSIGASAGFGYVFLLNRGINISLGANYDFALNNSYTNNDFQHKVNNFSLGLNLMKRIK